MSKWIGSRDWRGLLNPKYSHGTRVSGARSPAYVSWVEMRWRCLSPRCRHYKNYGGRGITICPRWDAFALFLVDMGPRPADTTLDRIDVNGNYEPNNCRWATKTQQNRNRRTTKLDESRVRQIRERLLVGDTKVAIARDFGISPSQVRFIQLGKAWA